jgi:2-polyprenyl-3-methyl-5-hydroxy-6-metoxy-1,4-benzoquinol methylase
LEIGCGVGTETKLLLDFLKQGSIYACDISPENIKIAKDSLKKYNNLSLTVCDSTELMLNEKFDVIIMPDVIEHIPLEFHERMFNNMSRMLANDGFIFIHIPNPFHTDYCVKNEIPLQIIDQAVHLNIMLDNLKNSGLFISKMEIYSVWQKEGEYEYMILKKKSVFNEFHPIKYKKTFISRTKEKIQYEWNKRARKKN